MLGIARARGTEFAELRAGQSAISASGLEERRIHSAEYSRSQGVGIRRIRGAQSGYAIPDDYARGPA